MVIVVGDHKGEVAYGGRNIWNKREPRIVGVVCRLVFHDLVVVNEILVRVVVGGVGPDGWVRHDTL